MTLEELFENLAHNDVEHSVVPATEFHEAILNAKRKLTGGAKAEGVNDLSVYSINEYKTGKTYLSEDQLSGYAIMHGDELVSVFSVARGRGNLIMRHAISMGARRLDCFAERGEDGEIQGHLYNLYTRYGFHIDESLNAGGQYPIKNGISPVEGTNKVVVYMKR